MRQWNTLAMAIIGATLTIVAPEMEKKNRESTMVVKISQEVRDNGIVFAPTTTGIRCKKKHETEINVTDNTRNNIIDIIADDPDRINTMTESNKFSIYTKDITKTKRITMSRKFSHIIKQFFQVSKFQKSRNIVPNTDVNLQIDKVMRNARSISDTNAENTELPINNSSALIIDEENIEKLISEEIKNNITELKIGNHDKLVSKEMSIIKLQNSLDDTDKTVKNNLFNSRQDLSSTSESIIYVKSEKLILSGNVSDVSTPNKLAETKVEGNIESPLFVENQAWPVDGLGKEKILDDEIMADEKLSYSRKDQSKPSANLLDGGKPSKVYYEIKPSLNTAMMIDEDDDDDDIDRADKHVPIIPVTRKNFITGFKLPIMPSSFGKFGPYFIDNIDHRNVTERIGNTVILDCKIGLLGDKKVTWLQHDKDSIRLLTVGNVQYSADERISLKFQYPDNWRLQIIYATLRDSGLYKCQVEIDPTHSLVKHYNVIITAPILKITDDSGRPISGERHLKAGSTLRLKCEGRDVLERLNESLLWTRGDETLTSDVSENRTTEIVDNEEMRVLVSTLLVEKATSRHAGNYSCTVPERAKTTIAVHVLNGELPAAVHHGNGVSSAMLNLWLIHLTISYGFFR